MSKPAEFSSMKLSQLVIKHQAGIYKKSDLYGSGVNIVGVQDLYRHNAINGQVFRFVPLTKAETEKFTLKEGELLYGESSLVLEGIAKTLYVTHGGAGTAFAWHSRRFSVKRSNIWPAFLYYALNSADARKYFRSVATQSALTGITTKDYFGITLHLPPLPEQRKIARILTTVDNLIEKTEALIHKYEQIKQGMMHDLFTRGVDADGKLRPPPAEAPELYKDSELGLVPKEWEVVRLGEEIKIKHGYAFSGEYFVDEPTENILLVPGNFHRNGGLYFTESNTKYYSGKPVSGYVLKLDDIVVVMTDLSPMSLILGRFARVSVPVLHNQRIGLVENTRESQWNRNYLLERLSGSDVRGKIISTAAGTTVKHTSPTKILANLISRPKLSEQDRIVSYLQNISKSIEAHRKERDKYIHVKQGLMQDLLTGKVRVKPDAEDEAPGENA